MTSFGEKRKFGKSFFNTDMMLCSEKQAIDRLRDMKEEMEKKFQKVFIRMAKCVNFKIQMTILTTRIFRFPQYSGVQVVLVYMRWYFVFQLVVFRNRGYEILNAFLISTVFLFFLQNYKKLSEVEDKFERIAAEISTDMQQKFQVFCAFVYVAY